MKKNLVIAVLALVAGGCTEPTSSAGLYVLPSAISSVPQSVSVGSDFIVTLTVSVGGCEQFKDVDVKATSTGARVTALAEIPHSNRNLACPDILRYQTVDVRVPGTTTIGPFTIVAVQPEGKTVTGQTAIGNTPNSGT